MENEIYEFTPTHSYNIPPAESDQIIIVFDACEGALLVTLAEETLDTFPLIDELGNSLEVSLYIDNTTQPFELQVGEACFYEEPLVGWYFPINGLNFESTIRAGGGSLGIIDIRDIGKAVGVNVFPEYMPVTLKIQGNYLHVSTLEYDESYEIQPWYEEYEVS